jgi:Uma2 family endonuclease
MAEPVRKQATYDDILAAPPHVVAELVEGTLYTSPRPAVMHAVAGSELGGSLINPFGRGRGGPGGWRILDEPELHFGTDVLVPDLASWRLERMPNPPKTAALELPPDWLAEVLSPSTRRIDRMVKMPVYARVGVKHVRLVDPEPRTIEVFRLHVDKYLLVAVHADDDVVHAEPFEAVALELCWLWGESPEAPPNE